MVRPLRVLMLAYPDCQLLDVTGPLQMFASANDELNEARYELVLAAPRKGVLRSSSGVGLMADASFGDLMETTLRPGDTVMAVGGSGVGRVLQSENPTALVRRARDGGARVASVCSGAFFLAAAGVLDGRRAATHWDAVDALKRFRPAIDVDAESIFIRDGNVWTSAGVTAGIDLALAMIEADCGRAAALAVARRNVVFRIRPGGQSQFSPELAGQGAKDPRLAKLTAKIAAHPSRDWRAEALAQEAGLSPRSLTRLFRRELGTSPAEFVERVRIDRARRALLDSNARIETLAIACGFGSLRKMDRAFSRAIATSPREFRARFRTERMME